MRWRAIAWVGLVVLALARSASPAAAEREYAEVRLVYDAEEGTCAADPDPVRIFWHKIPNKVVWVSDDADLYWEVNWKGDGKDYFRSNFDIKCGQTEKRSTLPSGRDRDNAQWAYDIAVYSCQGGQRTSEKLCEVDPLVDWEP